MSIDGGPDIIKDGLVLCLDAGNRNSYKSGSTTWFDLSINNNTGSLVNGPTFNSSNNGSIVFDGSNDNVLLGDTLDLGTNDLTINVWAYKTAAPSAEQYLVSKSRAAAQNYRYGFAYTSTQKLVVFFQGNTGAGTDINPSGSTTIPINTWHMATMVATRSSSIKIYLNGVPETLGSSATISQWNGLDFQSNNPFRLGSYTSSDNTTPIALYTGRISMAQVYFRSLSDAEVLQNYNANKGRFGL
jgi:hypothetical protein